ncbi:MAG: cysteine desulfurase-like protein [Leptolyngbyaceae cyanobacterium SM1_1_3]|nr:cysteine desulfurase-like protein [Leptolyngbyaceae cyanobacterium SM1_1_3]NJN05004.1 cysteine desulfurase-like protein [Leptolyngbyaceae cyanobacterium RM1_1_2]
MTSVHSTTQLPLNLEWVRATFPSVGKEWVFLDNAGGSQIAQPVIERLNQYLLTSNVQLGASYAVSQLASQRLAQANQAAAMFINAADPAEVVMGPSTSLLLRILASCLSQTFKSGDEVIVTNCDHEANITPWLELQRQGIKVKFWLLRPETLALDLVDLENLLSDKTRLVALTHASNVLGTINPIREIADLVHRSDALLCVDGVGYAPHRLIDVQAMDVDFYVFSYYKVYGPHHALLYGKHQHLLPLPSFNHSFIGKADLPYKLQPGGANYELSYSTLGILDYLEQLVPDDNALTQRDRLSYAFDSISAYEEMLSDRLLSFLLSQPQVKVIGETRCDRQIRVPTVAFTVTDVDSATVPPRLEPYHIGIRSGDFYAKRLIQDLGLAAQNGVVRVSLVHYNTLEECDRLIEQLEPLLSA